MALGAQLKRSAGWSLSFGAAYDSSCLDDADRGASFPLGESWKFGFGARKNLSENLELALNYELAWAGSLAVDQQSTIGGRLAGAFEDTALHFLSGSLRWRL